MCTTKDNFFFLFLLIIFVAKQEVPPLFPSEIIFFQPQKYDISKVHRKKLADVEGGLSKEPLILEAPDQFAFTIRSVKGYLDV